MGDWYRILTEKWLTKPKKVFFNTQIVTTKKNFVVGILIIETV